MSFIDISSIESSLEIPQKIKNQTVGFECNTWSACINQKDWERFISHIKNKCDNLEGLDKKILKLMNYLPTNMLMEFLLVINEKSESFAERLIIEIDILSKNANSESERKNFVTTKEQILMLYRIKVFSRLFTEVLPLTEKRLKSQN
jgi:hypothetical protein